LARPLHDGRSERCYTTDKPMPQMKTILSIVLALIVVGVALWLVNTYIPMAGAIKAILNIVVVIATCVGVLQAFGLWSGIVKLWSDLISHRLPR
jgi:predicted membrane protein